MTGPLPYTEQPDGSRVVCIGMDTYTARQVVYPSAAGWQLARGGVFLSLEPDWDAVARRIRDDW